MLSKTGLTELWKNDYDMDTSLANDYRNGSTQQVSVNVNSYTQCSAYAKPAPVFKAIQAFADVPSWKWWLFPVDRVSI